MSSNTEGSQSTPAVAFTPGGGFVAAWSSGPLTYPTKLSDLYARRFNAANQPLGPEFRVNTTLFNEQGTPQVAVDSHGNFLIGWLNFGGEGTFHDVYARRFTAAGTPLGDDFQVNSGTTESTPQYEFAMALRDSGESVFVWTDAAGEVNEPGGDYGSSASSASASPPTALRPARSSTSTPSPRGPRTTPRSP